MLRTSKRMLTERQTGSVVNKYRTILIGDPYCGKSSYIQLLARKEKESGSPIIISEDQNEFEFSVGTLASNRAIFIVYDTASIQNLKNFILSFISKLIFFRSRKI